MPKHDANSSEADKKQHLCFRGRHVRSGGTKKKKYSKGAGHSNCDIKKQVPFSEGDKTCYSGTQRKTNNPSRDKAFKY